MNRETAPHRWPRDENGRVWCILSALADDGERVQCLDLVHGRHAWWPETLMSSEREPPERYDAQTCGEYGGWLVERARHRVLREQQLSAMAHAQVQQLAVADPRSSALPSVDDHHAPWAAHELVLVEGGEGGGPPLQEAMRAWMGAQLRAAFRGGTMWLEEFTVHVELMRRLQGPLGVAATKPLLPTCIVPVVKSEAARQRAWNWLQNVLCPGGSVGSDFLDSVKGGVLGSTAENIDPVTEQCPVCLTDRPSPSAKALAVCGHHVCLQCLPRCVERERIPAQLRCPVCRRACSLDGKGCFLLEEIPSLDDGDAKALTVLRHALAHDYHRAVLVTHWEIVRNMLLRGDVGVFGSASCHVRRSRQREGPMVLRLTAPLGDLTMDVRLPGELYGLDLDAQRVDVVYVLDHPPVGTEQIWKDNALVPVLRGNGYHGPIRRVHWKGEDPGAGGLTLEEELDALVQMLDCL